MRYFQQLTSEKILGFIALLLLGAILWGTLTLSGCARIHVECPADGVEHVIIGGNNAGTVALAGLLALMKSAGPVMAASQMKAPAGALAPGAMTTVDYTYMPIMGMDFISCGSGEVPG